MAVRIRLDGSIVCAAASKPELGDFYIDDNWHYKLSVEKNILITKNHFKHNLWWWNRGKQ
jgi:hypothetical protein